MVRPILTALIALGLAVPGFGDGVVPRPSPEFAIGMTPTGQKLLSEYRGKVVLLGLILTTCPHCQNTTKLLTGLQNEYGPRGLQVIEVAFNPMAHMLVPDFVKQFQPSFPVGFATRDAVLSYLEHPTMMQLYVPILVFIDRHGVIQHQYLGDDPFQQNQEKNIRDTIETMLKEPAAKKKTSVTTAKKKDY